MPAELSDYEKQRLANIAQNQSVLAQLGLADGECKLKPPPPPRKRPVPHKDDDEEEPQQPTRKSARVANAPVCYTELSDEFCLREEKKLAALERDSSRPQRERKGITSYSDQQAEEIMANEEANATKRWQKARQQQQEEQRQRASLAAAAYAANPVLPDMTTARFVPQQVTKKKGLCWRCGQMWSLRKDGTIRDHSCTPILGAVAQQPFVSAHLPVM